MYVGKQKYFNHDLSAVDIPFFEMILPRKIIRGVTTPHRLCFTKGP